MSHSQSVNPTISWHIRQNSQSVISDKTVSQSSVSLPASQSVNPTISWHIRQNSQSVAPSTHPSFRQPVLLVLIVMFSNHSVSKLLESLSLGSGSSKLTKLFHHHTSSSSSSSPSKKLNPAMQYLLQSGPQGLIRIWPIALSEEMNYCSFMVNMTTTSAEIIKLVMEKYAVVDDPRRFYICETSLGKGGKLCSV